MICATITAPTNSKAREDLFLAAKVADVAELRLDFLQETPDLPYLLEGRPCPVIVANRPGRQGGFYSGSETERVMPLREAVELGAEFVDIEYDAVGLLREKLGTRVIVSYHDFEKTPEDLRAVAQMLLGTGGDIIKVAAQVNDITEIFRLCQMAEDTGVPKIVIGMGTKGVATRILAPKFGGFLTYAALRRGEGSAPGQLTAAELRGMYRYASINKATKVFGVIANPVTHSLSPQIHNAVFKKLGLDSVYLPLEVDDLGGFLAGCHCMDPAGFSVTIPHKEEALKLVDEADETAKKIGAANTIAVRGKRLAATNTDCLAAVDAIKGALAEGETLAGKKVLLLGAGGTARAMAFGLVAEGARVTIANRTHERAVRLAGEIGAEVVEWDRRAAVEAGVIANSTSLGMYPAVDITPFPASGLKAGQVVFDAVYNPRETRLLEEARAAGCRVVEGLEMFVHQAAAQFRFWTGLEAPVEVMRDAAVMALDRA